jgi:hypothetical protein
MDSFTSAQKRLRAQMKDAVFTLPYAHQEFLEGMARRNRLQIITAEEPIQPPVSASDSSLGDDRLLQTMQTVADDC